MENRINELIESISQNDNYRGCVYWGRGIYFIIRRGEILEISDDAGCSPRGGWFPDIFKGPTVEEDQCLMSLMESLGFDEEFFSNLIEDYGEFDVEYIEEYFEETEDEDSMKIYRKIKKKIDSGKTPFGSVNDFASALLRYGLDSDCLYSEWEGEFIDLYDNIAETGGKRGSYDRMSDQDWIELLENIDKHIVQA